MGSNETNTLVIEATDVSMQKKVKARNVEPDSSVGELVESLIESLRLSPTDASGRPLAYSALLQREGRHLHLSERVGDAIQPGDQIVLAPSVEAGGGY